MNYRARSLVLLTLVCLLQNCKRPIPDTVVIISANAEWSALKEVLPSDEYDIQQSPYGEYFVANSNLLPDLESPVLFLHGVWGKVDAAASAQWAISKFQPKRIINLGTAGGFEGRIKENEVVFASKTIIYDIIERMGSGSEAIQDYATEINSEVPPELRGLVVPCTLISADQDIDPAAIKELTGKYDAVAADWESASIARVAQKNGVQVLILREISDVVSASGSPTYGDLEHFKEKTRSVMRNLLDLLQMIQ